MDDQYGNPIYQIIKRINVHLPSGETQELWMDDTPYVYQINGSPIVPNGIFNSQQESNTSFNFTDPITNNSSWLVKYEYDDYGNITATTYTYDDLNRLKSSTETANAQVAWKQTFSYDRFGNRTLIRRP